MNEIERARKLVEAGNAAEALLIFTSALRIREDGELWNDWASAAFACGDPKLAESGYRRALELDPSQRQAAINLAALLLKQKRFEESIPIIQPLVRSLNEQEKNALRQLATASELCAEMKAVAPASSATASPVSQHCEAPVSEKPLSIELVHCRAIKIAVITPSLPARQGLLSECRASVGAQTLPPEEHMIRLDTAKRGPSVLRNELVSCLHEEIDWIAFLDDDDLLLPGHLERLALEASSSDIVYSKCHIDGPPVPWRVQAFNPLLLQRENYIPVTVLMRRRLFESLGGFRSLERDEDHDLWKRALAAGARFRFIDEMTWVYRMRSDSRTYGGAAF